MTFKEIRNMPTVSSDVEGDITRMHESLFQSYHILEKVEELLQKGTPTEVIFEIIADLRNREIYGGMLR